MQNQAALQPTTPWFFRRWPLLDLPITGALRGADLVIRTLFKKETYFSEETLLTHKERQLKVLEKQLEGKKACAPFVEATHRFIHTAIRHTSGEALTHLPRVGWDYSRYWMKLNRSGVLSFLPAVIWAVAAERMGLDRGGMLYTLPIVLLAPVRVFQPLEGYGLVYAYDRYDRANPIAETSAMQAVAPAIGRLFCRARTLFAHHVIGSPVIWDYSVNVKQLVYGVLNGVDKIEKRLIEKSREKSDKDSKIPKRVAALIKAIGPLLKENSDIDTKIAKKKFSHPDDAFMFRLSSLEAANLLPRGLPLPNEVRADELAKKREEALLAYGKNIAEWYFDKHAPDSLDKGLFGWIWWLEGKHHTVETLGALITEFGLKQIIDPHKFYIAILTAFVDTLGLEPDKFGQDKSDRIFETGMAMMEKSLEEGVSPESIKKIFLESGLKSGTTGIAVTEQKKEAREQLKKILSGLLYSYIKPKKERSSKNTVDSVIAQASRFPGLGFTTMFVRGVVNGLIFTVQHIQDGKGFHIEELIREMVGKNYVDALVDKALDIIERPEWPIYALKMVDTMINSFSAKKQDRKIPDEVIKSNIEIIGTFLGKNAAEPILGQGSQLAAKVTAYFTTGKAFEELQQASGIPQNIAILQTALPLIQPTMKELGLYMHVTDIFRKMGVEFAGDSKFYESLLRVRLDRQTDPRIDEATGTLKKSPNYAPLRETLIDELLSLDSQGLRQKLSTSGDFSKVHFIEEEKKKPPAGALLPQTLVEAAAQLKAVHGGQTKTLPAKVAPQAQTPAAAAAAQPAAPKPQTVIAAAAKASVPQSQTAAGAAPQPQDAKPVSQPQTPAVAAPQLKKSPPAAPPAPPPNWVSDDYSPKGQPKEEIPLQKAKEKPEGFIQDPVGWLWGSATSFTGAATSFVSSVVSNK